jgi:hypothetical protein
MSKLVQEVIELNSIRVYYIPLVNIYDFHLPSGAKFVVPAECLDDMIKVFKAAKSHSSK